MKQLYTILLMLLACCSWVSCGSDKSGETFNVKMDVTALGEDKEYTLKEFADATDDLSLVSTQPSWVTVTYSINENNQWVVKVSVEENTESDERQHQVILKAQNGNQLLLDITQKAPVYFELQMDFGAKGGSRTVTLEDFAPPVVFTKGEEDWIKLTWKSETSKSLTVTVAANSTDAKRNAQIIMTDSDGNHTTLSVQQDFFTDQSDDTTEEPTDQPAL